MATTLKRGLFVTGGMVCANAALGYAKTFSRKSNRRLSFYARDRIDKAADEALGILVMQLVFGVPPVLALLYANGPPAA